MSVDPDRRFTDREVALVLRRAAELEESRKDGPGTRGLSLTELRHIAGEVGIRADAIDDAVAHLESRGPLAHGSVLGPSATTKAVQAVPARLAEPELQQLVRAIEERLETPGTVTEALGSIRWTSVAGGHKFQRVTQVVFTPLETETQVQVTQRYAPQLRAVLNLLPCVWGGMIGFVTVASAGLSVFPAIGAVVGMALAGGAVGRGIWTTLARRSRQQSHDLATALVTTAARISRSAAVSE